MPARLISLASCLLIATVLALVPSVSVLGRGGPTPGANFEILTPTDGVNFAPFLTTLKGRVTESWLKKMPESARMGQKGKVIVRFRIGKDGTLEDVVPFVETTSGKDDFDKAALEAIMNAAPFERFPDSFQGNYIWIKAIFLYNILPDSPHT
jgi:TonB family protein